MGAVKQRPTVVPASATATYLPLSGWTRPSSPTAATSPYVGGIIPSDVLVGVSSQVGTLAAAALSASTAALASVNVPLPDLPALSPTSSEQPILLVQAMASHAVPHLVVSGLDALPSIGPTAARSSYLPAGGAVSTYAALVKLYLQTDGTNAAGGSVQVRVNAQLYVRRLGQ